MFVSLHSLRFRLRLSRPYGLASFDGQAIAANGRGQKESFTVMKNKLVLITLLFTLNTQCSESPIEVPLDKLESMILQKVKTTTSNICNFFGFNQQEVAQNLDPEFVNKAKTRIKSLQPSQRRTLAKPLFYACCMTIAILQQSLVSANVHDVVLFDREGNFSKDLLRFYFYENGKYQHTYVDKSSKMREESFLSGSLMIMKTIYSKCKNPVTKCNFDKCIDYYPCSTYVTSQVMHDMCHPKFHWFENPHPHLSKNPLIEQCSKSEEILDFDTFKEKHYMKSMSYTETRNTIARANYLKPNYIFSLLMTLVTLELILFEIAFN